MPVPAGWTRRRYAWWRRTVPRAREEVCAVVARWMIGSNHRRADQRRGRSRCAGNRQRGLRPVGPAAHLRGSASTRLKRAARGSTEAAGTNHWRRSTGAGTHRAHARREPRGRRDSERASTGRKTRGPRCRIRSPAGCRPTRSRSTSGTRRALRKHQSLPIGQAKDAHDQDPDGRTRLSVSRHGFAPNNTPRSAPKASGGHCGSR